MTPHAAAQCNSMAQAKGEVRPFSSYFDGDNHASPEEMRVSLDSLDSSTKEAYETKAIKPALADATANAATGEASITPAAGDSLLYTGHGSVDRPELRICKADVEKALGLRKLPTLAVSVCRSRGTPGAGALRLLTAASLASGAETLRSTTWGGAQAFAATCTAAAGQLMTMAMYAPLLATMIALVPRSTRHLAVLATLVQPALAAWTDITTVVESTLSTYSTYVLIMVPVTLVLAGVKLADLSCATATALKKRPAGISTSTN